MSKPPLSAFTLARITLFSLVLAVSGCGKPAPEQAGSAKTVDWAVHGGDNGEQRFSPLKSVNTTNVDQLGLAWSFDLGISRGIEATPIVVDGVMYVTGTWNIVHALNAKTGAPLWRFDPEVDRSKAAHLCCDAVNRGVAVWKGLVIVGTIDGRLVAINKHSGNKVWDVVTVDQSKPYTITGAPRVIKDKVLIGNGGAEFGVRGYISAYAADSGKQLWRFYTVPGNPEKGFENEAMAEAAKTWNGQWWKFGGGGTVWDSMAYDADLDLLYIGVGNGSPWNQKIRSPGGGDNLYLSSIVALKPDSGDYVWHYQTTPGETWDYTATQHLILADIEIAGETRKVIMQAPKNGFFYVLDRSSGELLSANNYVDVNWATHIDPVSGRPVEVAGARYTLKPFLQMPGPLGGHNWHPMSFNPDTGLVYIPTLQTPFIYADDHGFKQNSVGWNTGTDNQFASLPISPGDLRAAMSAVKGNLVAWNPQTQTQAWSVPHSGPWNGGTLSTAGGLVFQGNGDANLVAYDAKDGTPLWQFFAGTGIVAPPVTYEIDGEQYVAVAAGWGGAFVLIYGGVPRIEHQTPTGRVLVFKLGGKAKMPVAEQVKVVKNTPPPLIKDEAMVAEGASLYRNNCFVCHGDHALSSNLVPHLRYSPLLHSAGGWQDVVIGGAVAQKGMPGFARAMSSADAEMIRAYVISAAHSEEDEAWFRKTLGLPAREKP